MFPVSILIIGGRLYRRVEKIRKILKFFDNRCSSLRYPLLYRNVGYETDGYRKFRKASALNAGDIRNANDNWLLF